MVVQKRKGLRNQVYDPQNKKKKFMNKILKFDYSKK